MTHPLNIIKTIENIYGHNIILEYSKYKYVPNSKTDTRTTHNISIDRMSRAWLNSELSSLDPNENLSLNSRVILNDGSIGHIPMLDFDTTNIDAIAAEACFDILGDIKLSIFDSGRSFHGYAPTILNQLEWYAFMGEALLCNPKGGADIVDQRWIGHRLMAGYSALRWSCNGKHYKKSPELIQPQRPLYQKQQP